MRLLKHHEQKLLKKVNFFNWSPENEREIAVVKKYFIQNREDYSKYNRLCGYVTKLTSLLRKLKPEDPFRIEMTEHLLNKLFNMGLIEKKKSLVNTEAIPVSSFCRRRLPVIMVKLKLASDLKEAITYIEQGHIRVGPKLITDPGFHVTRQMEDFVTWTHSSAIKKKVLRYNEKLDDYDLIQ